MRKIIFPLILTIIISVITTYYLFKWMVEHSIHPLVENSFSEGQIIKLFITWMIYFFALITLPFLLTYIIRSVKIKEKDWWKGVIVFELLSLTFAYMATPPDIVSTILFFLICQPIVIVNGIVLKRKLIEV